MIERFPTSGVFRLLRPRPATMRTIRACELPLRSTRAGSRTRRRRTRCAGRDLRYLRSGPRGCAGHGRTADRFQNGIPAGLPVSRPTTAFQLATYRQITPGASCEVRIDEQSGEDPDCPDRATVLHCGGAGYPGHPGPVSDGAEGHGNRDVLSEPAVYALQPQALQLLEALRRGVRRPDPVVLTFVPTQ